MTSQKGIIMTFTASVTDFLKNFLFFLKHSNTNSVVNQQTLYHFKLT